MWPSGLTLTMTLTLTFQGQIWNLLYLSQKWCDCHKTKANISIGVKASNVTIEFDLGHDIDLEFSRSNVEFAISLPKKGPIAPKRKANISIEPWDSNVTRLDLTLAITLTLNFQGKICNLLYLNEKWSDCYTTKSKISIELQAPNVTNGFDLDHDLDIWIFKVKCDLDHLVTKVRRKDLPDRDWGDFRCRRAVDSSC